jgi:uncharacterized membrane protein
LGECHNTNGAAFAEAVTIAARTTNSSYYPWLTAAAGQSFRDNGSIRTTALTYDASTYAAINKNTSFTTTLTVACERTVIDRLQIGNAAYQGFTITNSGGGVADFTVKNCILKDAKIGNFIPNVINCLVISGGTTLGNNPAGTRFEFCTLVNTGGGSPGLGTISFGTTTLENCAVFGFGAGFTFGASGAVAGDYNCTDLASGATSPPGAHSLYSKTFANQFVSTTNDFRAKTGADLTNAGTPATSYATDDISATSRSGSTPTIGAWELVASGAYTLAVDAGSYAVSGVSATLKAARRVSATAGSYAIAGQTAGLKRGLKVLATAGSYAITGLDATLSKAGQRVLDAIAGVYGLTGSAANLIVTRRMSASAGVYATTGQATTLSRTRRLVAAAGSYLLNGIAALLSRTVVLTGAPTLDGNVFVDTTVDLSVHVDTDQSANVRVE